MTTLLRSWPWTAAEPASFDASRPVMRHARRVKPQPQVTSADWIAPRLGGEFGRVTRFAPSAYAAYARMCHPVDDDNGRRVSWSQVAAVTGRQAHPTMQWHAVIGSNDPFHPRSDLWPAENPAVGNVEPDVLAALCTVLTAHTSTPGDCRFALWDGYGWVRGGRAVAVLSASTDRTDVPDRAPNPVLPGVPRGQLAGPRVRHPGRDYLLFEGALDTIGQLGWQVTEDWFDPQSPNLFWPVDRAWFVATEIDLDSTIIAGTRPLIDAILATPELDAWPLQPDDSLAADADTINS